MTCHSSGRSPIMFIGLGALAGPSRMRMPRPPQNSTTFMSCHLQRGDREDQLAAPVPYVAQLGGDLSAQVPGQDQHIVGPVGGDPVRVVDRDVRTRQEPALLVRAAVD